MNLQNDQSAELCGGTHDIVLKLNDSNSSEEEEEQDLVQNDEIVQFYKKNTNGTRVLCPD